MAIYIYSTSTSSVNPTLASGYTKDFNTIMKKGASTDGTLTVTIPSPVGFKAGIWVTDGLVPNNADWGSGVFTIELEIDAGNVNIQARCRPVRISVSGVVQQNGDWSDWKLCNVSRIYDAADANPPQSPAGGNWTPGSALDLIMIEWEFEHIGVSGSQSITIGTGTTANEVDSPVGENTGRRIIIM